MNAGMGLERVRDKIMQGLWSGVGKCWNEIQRGGEASFKEKLDLGYVLGSLWQQSGNTVKVCRGEEWDQLGVYYINLS